MGRKKVVIILIYIILLFQSIPITNAVNNQMITKNDSHIKFKNNLEKNIMISGLHKSTYTLEKNLSIITSSGSGIGFFIPPKLNREKFFCIAGIIIYTRPWSDTLINNDYHSGFHILIFIGFAAVVYTKYLLADDIDLLGVGFAKAFP